jgi:parvulin-like peptidyl-prolyl isomerase
MNGRIAAGAVAALIMAVVPAWGANDQRVVAKGGKVIVPMEEAKIYIHQEFHLEPGEMFPEAKRAAVEKFLVRKMLAHEAENKGIYREPAVDQALFRWKIEYMPEWYWKTQVADKTKVSDKEVWEMLKPQDLYLVSAIVLGRDEEGKAEAQKIYQRLLAGADFEMEARAHSLGITANAGGDMGYRTLPNPFVGKEHSEVIKKLKPMEVTRPLMGEIGWIVYQLRGVRTAQAQFKEQKEETLRDLTATKANERVAAAKAELLKKAKITYPADEPGAPHGAPLAVVNGYVISPDALGGSGPQHDFLGDISTRKERLRKFIESFLTLKEMERTGLDRHPDIFNRFLVARAIILSGVILDREITRMVAQPTPTEIEAEYRRFYLPEIFELQMVLTDDRGKAQAARKEVDAGRDFGEVSKEYSLPALATSKGHLPPKSLADYPPEVKSAVESLADGQVTGVLAGGEKLFYVIKRLGKKTVEVPPLKGVESDIRRRLVLNRRAAAAESFMSDYLKKNKTTIDQKLLKEL